MGHSDPTVAHTQEKKKKKEKTKREKKKAEKRENKVPQSMSFFLPLKHIISNLVLHAELLSFYQAACALFAFLSKTDK